MTQQSNYNRVLLFANQNPTCHLATVEGNQPRVRGLLLWYADESGFYFHTASTKNLPRQLEKNPKIEIAFLKASNNPAEMEAMRVCGEAEFIKDTEMEERLLSERPWLKGFEKNAPNSKPVIFRIHNGEAYFWNMSTNLQEDSVVRVKI